MNRNTFSLDALRYNYVPRAMRIAPLLLLAAGVVGAAGFALAHTPIVEQIAANAGSTPGAFPNLIPTAEPGTGNLHSHLGLLATSSEA